MGAFTVIIIGIILSLTTWRNVTMVPITNNVLLKQLTERPEVQLLREYIRINTSGSNNLGPAVDFWQKQADAVGLQCRVYEPAGMPIVVLTWEGSDPSLPSIMLNTHIDVVPAIDDEWTYPPFAAEMDSDGNIYGRGTQDTKGLSIQHLEAIRRLKNNNVTLLRTVHITLIPDEETGSAQGMQPFLKTKDFYKLNVGFALDEGVSAPGDEYSAFYVDRRPWQIKFTFQGPAGHGSLMPDNTAIESFQKMLNRLMNFREQQKNIMRSQTSINYGYFTSVNINEIAGGLAVNVIPGEMCMTVDMRLASDVNSTEFKALIDKWVAETGNTTRYEFIRRVDTSVSTPIDDSNPYWVALQDYSQEMNIVINPQVLSATSDMIFVRDYGVPALGLSTFINTETRIHGIDEYVNANTFLQGIDMLEGLVNKLANLH